MQLSLWIHSPVMKKAFVFLVILFAASSCKNTWTGDDKEMFHQACMEDATTWAGGEDKARTYCNCVLDTVMAKYPHISDALEHINELTSDPAVRSCKAGIVNDVKK